METETSRESGSLLPSAPYMMNALSLPLDLGE